MSEDRIFAGRGRWAIASVAIALCQMLWLITTVRSSGLLNRSQIAPILLLGSIGWVLGCGMGLVGVLSRRVAARVVAGLGLAGNIAGLVITAAAYAKWWVA